MKTIAVFLFLLFASVSVFAQWSQTSGPSGGGVSDFAFTNGKILAATFDIGNGVFASTDSGTSWHESGLQGIRLSHISANGSILIASSTLNSYNETDTIYRSSDAGVSWQTIMTLPNILTVRSICYHNHQWFITTQGQNGKMYVSNDDGATWYAVHPFFDFAYPVILVSVGVHIIAGSSSNGYITIYRSVDGVAWERDTSGIGTLHPSDVYCGSLMETTVQFGIAGGTIASTDEGATWRNSLVLSNRAEYIAHIAGYASQIFAISSLNKIYRSETSGKAWDQLTGNGLDLETSNFYSVSFDGDILLLGSSIGIITSKTLGYAWRYSTDGLHAAALTDIVVNQGKIFAATQRGVSYSDDAGTSWHEPQSSADLNATRISGFFGGNSKFFAFGDGLYSWDGSVWTTLNLQDFTSMTEGLSGRLFSGHKGDDPITGVGGIDISDNGGTTWTASVVLTNSIDTELYFLPKCLSSNGRYIVAAERVLLYQTFSSKYFIYQSPDNGKSWNAVETPYTPTFITYTGYAFYMGTYSDGLFRSVDNGATWSRLTGMITALEVTSLLKIGNTFLVSIIEKGSSAQGLYRSDDNGFTWKFANYNTANIFGPMATDGTYLYSGGPSVWKRPLNELSVQERKISQPNFAIKLYPNPGTDMIHLHLDSATPIRGTLIVNDEKGSVVIKREINLLSGKDNITLPISKLASGTYFCAMSDESGNIIATQKFVKE